MRSTFAVYFFAKKDKQKANGNYPIFVRITIDGVASRFNSKTDVPPNAITFESRQAKIRESGFTILVRCSRKFDEWTDKLLTKIDRDKTVVVFSM